MALSLTLALSGGCSLKETPASSVTRESFYRNVDQCKSALRACYTPLQYIYCTNFMLAVEACTDIWTCYSSSGDAYLDISPASPGVGNTVWKFGYIGVMRTNECVDRILASSLPDEDRLPLAAEARAMRALYWYILTSFFGDVPFYTCPVTDVETMEKIRALPRRSAEEIRSEIYNDLKDNALPYFTAENGLKVRASEVADEHAGFALTAMLMAKLAMWNRDWSGALEAIAQLEDVYGEFSEERYPLSDTDWSVKNAGESIFEYRHEWSATGTKFAGNVAATMMPRCEGNGVYDGVLMPDFALNGTTWSPLKATKHFAYFHSSGLKNAKDATTKNSLFNNVPMKFTDEVYNGKSYRGAIDLAAISSGKAWGETLDRRTLLVLGMGNLKSGGTFTTLSNLGVLYPGPKFWCDNMTSTYDSNNYRIFRYADAVLMAAECHAMKDEMEDALKYLNMVRRRAGLSDLVSYTGSEDLMREIQNERAKELGGEFQRKFDLVRWGIWYEQTSKFNDQPKLKSRIRPCHRYYPIPDTECALSGYVLTNDEYAQQ